MNTQKRIYALFVLLFAIYCAVIFLTPPDPTSIARYHVTAAYLRLVSVTFALPLAIIWFAAFYAWAKLTAYANSIAKSPEAGPMMRLASGVGVLAVGLPVTSIISSILNYMTRNNAHLVTPTTIVNNYVSLIFPLIAYFLVRRGAKSLADLTKKELSNSTRYFVYAVFAVLTVAYVYIVLTNPIRTVSNIAGVKATFFLRDWLIVLTIILPYLYIWFSGLLAAAYLNLYRRNTQGLIYKSFLARMSVGIGAVIITSIMLQFLANESAYLTAKFYSSASLNALLIFVYVLLIVIAVGYILIATGAKKLKQIEEV